MVWYICHTLSVSCLWAVFMCAIIHCLLWGAFGEISDSLLSEWDNNALFFHFSLSSISVFAIKMLHILINYAS